MKKRDRKKARTREQELAALREDLAAMIARRSNRKPRKKGS